MAEARHCVRCRSELPKDSGYCVTCGFQNIDLVAKSATAQFARKEQVDKLKAQVGMRQFLGKFFWFLR